MTTTADVLHTLSPQFLGVAAVATSPKRRTRCTKPTTDCGFPSSTARTAERHPLPG